MNRNVFWLRRLRAFAAQLTAPVAAEVSASSARLSWLAVRDAVSYTLQRGDAASTGWATVHTTAKGLTFIDTGLASGTSYLYRVGVTNGAGVTRWSPSLLVSTSGAAVPPATPIEAPVVESVGTTVVDLSLPVVSGATRYLLQREGASVGTQDTVTDLHTFRSSTLASHLTSADPIKKRIAEIGHADWAGDWISTANVQSYIAGLVSQAGGKPFPAVLYAIPGRDSGLYSAGGFPDRASYLAWVQKCRDGSGSAKVWWILEPDAVTASRNFDASTRAERAETIRQAVVILKGNPNARVYIDAGNATWAGADEMAGLLMPAGIADADGFSCNVSNFIPTEQTATWADAVNAGLVARGVTGKKYLVDSSRNGNGELPTNYPGASAWFVIQSDGSDRKWANPPGRGAGLAPQQIPGHANGQTLYVKKVGESDGQFPTASTNQTILTAPAPAPGTWYQSWWDNYAANTTLSNLDSSLYGTIYDGPNTAYSDTGLTAGTVYRYRYAAANGDGTSGWSPVAEATTATVVNAPATPTTAPASSNVTSTSVTLTMPAVSGATSYELQRSLSSGTGYATVSSGSARVFDDTRLSPGTAYFYRYRPSNAAGPSAGWSPVTSVTTLSGVVVGATVQPMSAKDAADHIGVVTHQNFGGTDANGVPNAVYQESVAVGKWVKHFNYRRMRSGLSLSNESSALAYVKFCRDQGVKWDVPIYSASGRTSDAQAAAKVKWLSEKAADVVGGFEGLNEPSHYFGATSTSEWMDAAMHYQEQIWGLRNKYPNLSNVPVLSTALHQKEAENALAAGENWWEMLAARGITRFFDVSALHSYGGSGGHPERKIDERVDLIKSAWVGKPVWVTETGYSDAWGHTTTEGSGLAYGARLALAYALRRVPFYNYELLDDAPSYQTGLQRVFGVVATGTTDAEAMNPANWKPKAVGRGLKSITDQWVEPAGTPNYTPTKVRCDISTSAANVVSFVVARKDQSDAGTATCHLYRLADFGALPVNVTVTDRVGARTFPVDATPTRVDLR